LPNISTINDIIYSSYLSVILSFVDSVCCVCCVCCVGCVNRSVGGVDSRACVLVVRSRVSDCCVDNGGDRIDRCGSVRCASVSCASVSCASVSYASVSCASVSCVRIGRGRCVGCRDDPLLDPVPIYYY
jgi:hypothetical protein